VRVRWSDVIVCGWASVALIVYRHQEVFVIRFLFGFAAIGCFVLAGCGDRVGDDAGGTATTPADGGAAAPAGGGGAPQGGEARPMSGTPAVLPIPVAIEGGVATLTPENTRIGFVGTHAGADPNPRVGGFERFTGKAEFEADNKTLKAVSADIETASVWTEAGDRLTTHLNSPDFFDTREYPQATFQSTEVKKDGDDAYTVTGDLTLHGTTKSITFPATTITAENKFTVRAEFTIDRTQFGMDKLTDRVEPEVKITVVIGEKTAPTQAAGGGPGGGGGGGPGGGRGNFDPAARFKQQDANGDGKLTGDEISERMKQNLAETDTDGNGEVSQEEFMTRMEQFRNRGPGGGAGGPGGGPGGPPAGEGSPAPGTDAPGTDANAPAGDSSSG
jgi:polyisoprenoid-binding protein YceI